MPAPQERDLNKATSSFKSWLIHEKGLDKNLDVEILGGPENTGCLLYTSPSPRD